MKRIITEVETTPAAVTEQTDPQTEEHRPEEEEEEIEYSDCHLELAEVLGVEPSEIEEIEEEEHYKHGGDNYVVLSNDDRDDRLNEITDEIVSDLLDNTPSPADDFVDRDALWQHIWENLDDPDNWIRGNHYVFAYN